MIVSSKGWNMAFVQKKKKKKEDKEQNDSVEMCVTFNLEI